MYQIIQSYRSGEMSVTDVPSPAVRVSGAIVQTAASLVSAGTERMIVELAKKSLLGKARARPDLVRKVVQKVRTEGLTSTIEKVFSRLDTPIPLGYSAAGTVVEIGTKVSGFKVGDRVACAGAGYATHAEFNYVPKNLMARIPDVVSSEDAAFTTVGAIALQGVRQADLRLGERVVVVGLGLIGLLTVQLLKASGCRVLGSDLDPSKCDLAKQLGADDAVVDLVDAAEAFTEGRGADAVIITAATPSNGPIEMAAEISRQRGRVVVVGMIGMNVPRDPFYKKELDLRLSMSYGPGRYDPSYEEGGQDYPFGYVRWTEQRNMEAFLDLVAAGRVTPSKLVTHRFPIEDGLKAYELLESKTEKYLAILLTYPQPENGDLTALPQRVVKLRSLEATPQIGIGLVGAGNFAKSVLMPALKRNESATMVGICTATGMSAAHTGKKNDFAIATTDYHELLNERRINTIFVATRHDTHARFALDALDAGKHVFLEKPLCVRRDELEQFEELMAQGKPMPQLLVGFNRRFSSHARSVRAAYENRRTPMVITYRVNAGMIPKDVWIQDSDAGGGRIIGELCHFVDLCEYLTGSTPTSVHAQCISSRDARITPEDSVVVTIGYADGSLATIQYIALGSSSLGKERIEVFADGSSAVIDDFITTTFHGLRQSKVKGKQDKGFDAEIAAFLAAVRSGGPAPINFDSIARTTRVTFDVLDSLRSGKQIAPEEVEASA